MGYDIPPYLQQDIADFAHSRQITPDEALVKLVQAGLTSERRKQETPLESGLGLLGSPEDAALLDAAVQIAYEERRNPASAQEL